MGKISMYTGGARCGKSICAQREAEQYKDVAYVATAVITDAEMADRVMRHKSVRPFNWVTYECPYDIPADLAGKKHDVFLLDCLTVHISNLIVQMKPDWEQDDKHNVMEQADIKRVVDTKIDELILFMQKNDADFIVVTNEVGMGVVPDSAMGRLFRDIAGKANQRMARAADNVTLLVSGIPVKLK